MKLKYLLGCSWKRPLTLKKMLFRWLDESSGTSQCGPAEVCRRFLAPGTVHYTCCWRVWIIFTGRGRNYRLDGKDPLAVPVENLGPCSLSGFCTVGAIITQLQNKHPEQPPLREGHRVEQQTRMHCPPHLALFTHRGCSRSVCSLGKEGFNLNA